MRTTVNPLPASMGPTTPSTGAEKTASASSGRSVRRVTQIAPPLSWDSFFAAFSKRSFPSLPSAISSSALVRAASLVPVAYGMTTG